MAKRRTQIDPETGNFFKVRLALEVNRILRERKLTQPQASELLDIVQPRVSDLDALLAQPVFD